MCLRSHVDTISYKVIVNACNALVSQLGVNVCLSHVEVISWKVLVQCERMKHWRISGGECTFETGGRHSQKRMQRWSVLKVNAPVSQVDCPTRPVCVACVRLVRNYITVQQDIMEQFIYWIVETFQLRIVWNHSRGQGHNNIALRVYCNALVRSIQGPV